MRLRQLISTLGMKQLGCGENQGLITGLLQISVNYQDSPLIWFCIHVATIQHLYTPVIPGNHVHHRLPCLTHNVMSCYRAGKQNSTRNDQLGYSCSPLNGCLQSKARTRRDLMADLNVALRSGRLNHGTKSGFHIEVCCWVRGHDQAGNLGSVLLPFTFWLFLATLRNCLDK